MRRLACLKHLPRPALRSVCARRSAPRRRAGGSSFSFRSFHRLLFLGIVISTCPSSASLPSALVLLGYSGTGILKILCSEILCSQSRKSKSVRRPALSRRDPNVGRTTKGKSCVEEAGGPLATGARAGAWNARAGPGAGTAAAPTSAGQLRVSRRTECPSGPRSRALRSGNLLLVYQCKSRGAQVLEYAYGKAGDGIASDGSYNKHTTYGTTLVNFYK